MLLAQGGCEVSGDSSASWLRIASGRNGPGPRPVVFEVAPNISGAPRTGVLRFANQSVTVLQAAGPALNVEPASIHLTGVAGQDCGSRSIRIRLTADGSPVQVSLANTTDREQWLLLRANTGSVSTATPFDAVIEPGYEAASGGHLRGADHHLFGDHRRNRQSPGHNQPVWAWAIAQARS